VERSKDYRALITVVVMRFAVLGVRAFLPLRLPEIWRQTDTLGVSLRYWNRWRFESGGSHPLMPAILASGDSAGIQAMECPILNIVMAPWFALGPHVGKIACLLSLFALAFILTAVNARSWKKREVSGIPAGLAMWMLPILALGADWSGKFMPDYISMVLVCMAIGLSWERDRPLPSFVLSLLGLLMKPTSAIVFGLLLASPGNLVRRDRVKWVLTSVALSFCYYIWGNAYIDGFRVGPSFYALHPPPFPSGIFQWITEPAASLKFILQNSFFPYGILLILAFVGWKSFKEGKNAFGRLWLILALQFFPLAILTGWQGMSHPYYFIGTTPVFCLLFMQSWEWAEGRRWLRAILAAGVLIHLIDLCHQDVKSLWARQPSREWFIEKQCAELTERNRNVPWKQGAAFRSSTEIYPTLGLCFGEREASKIAPFGFFWRGDPIPSECREADSTKDVVLVKCSP
jgi:hypothetical protein